MVADLVLIRTLVLNWAKPYDLVIYLYGSQANGSAGPYSDVDIAILPNKPLPTGALSDLREALDESTVLLSVEIVNLSEADDSFRDKVLREGVLWKD